MGIGVLPEAPPGRQFAVKTAPTKAPHKSESVAEPAGGDLSATAATPVSHRRVAEWWSEWVPRHASSLVMVAMGENMAKSNSAIVAPSRTRCGQS